MKCHPSANGGQPHNKTRKVVKNLRRPAAAEDGREISMMIVYTAQAKKNFDSAGKNINTAMANAVGQINAALQFNKIDLHVTAVYTGQTDYAIGSGYGADLDRIRDTDAGKSIRDLQDANAADVVALIREEGDMDGISYMLKNDGLDYSDSGIEVIAWSCVDEGYKCLAHEFGHILGCAHDRGNVDVVGWSDAYSYGYCFTASDGYPHGDLMAYACANFRETLYSDPLSKFKISAGDAGVPTGIAAPDANAADNARTIRETKAIVANYRTKT